MRTVTADITTAQKGDIVRFKAYALRVESEPVRGAGSIALTGRISIDGCPVVTRRFLSGRIVKIEKGA